MNLVSDPQSITAGSALSPEANQAAALAASTGVLTVDLDAIVSNWRRLENILSGCSGCTSSHRFR